MNVTRNKAEIVQFASRHGYALREEQGTIGLLIFENMMTGVQISVYTTTMTVATALHHPKKGKTQLFRRGVTLALLGSIFKKPRIHTGKGYFGHSPRQRPNDLLGISKGD